MFLFFIFVGFCFCFFFCSESVDFVKKFTISLVSCFYIYLNNIYKWLQLWLKFLSICFFLYILSILVRPILFIYKFSTSHWSLIIREYPVYCYHRVSVAAVLYVRPAPEHFPALRLVLQWHLRTSIHRRDSRNYPRKKRGGRSICQFI